MREITRPSGFTSDAARERFLRAYDQAFESLWTLPAEAQDVPTGFGVVRVYRAGPVEGDPVVLLSGAGGNALAWYRYIEPLARIGPVIAIDPLGEAGRSVQTRPITNAGDVGGWLADLLAGLDVRRAHLVGSSFGGWTALVGMRVDADRVAAVTLVDPAGFAPVAGRFYRWVILGGLAGLLPRLLRHRAARWLGNGTLREDALMRLGLAGRGFRRRLPTPPVWSDEQLRAVPSAVQALLGARSAMHDAATVADRLATVVPHWRVEIVPDTGHALPIEAPDLVADRVTRFGRTGAPEAL